MRGGDKRRENNQESSARVDKRCESHDFALKELKGERKRERERERGGERKEERIISNPVPARIKGASRTISR